MQRGHGKSVGDAVRKIGSALSMKIALEDSNRRNIAEVKMKLKIVGQRRGVD